MTEAHAPGVLALTNRGAFWRESAAWNDRSSVTRGMTGLQTSQARLSGLLQQGKQVVCLGFGGAGWVSVEATVPRQQHGQPEGRPQGPVGVHPLLVLSAQSDRVG